MEKWWWIRRVILKLFFLLLFRVFFWFSVMQHLLKSLRGSFLFEGHKLWWFMSRWCPDAFVSLLSLALASPLVFPLLWTICPKEPTEVTSYTKNPPRMPHFIGKIPINVVQHYNIKLDQQHIDAINVHFEVSEFCFLRHLEAWRYKIPTSNESKP